MNPTPLRGRAGEWTQVLDVLEQAGQGLRSLLVIEGPRGIGRTRLLRELVIAAKRSHCIVFEHRGWMPSVVLAQMTSQHQLLASQLAGLSAGASTRPVLVAWDDPRWTDPNLLLAMNAARPSTPILWALTRRTGDGSPCSALLEATNLVSVELVPLSAAEVASALADLLGATPSADVLSLAAAASGNPSDLVELVHGLREECLVTVEHGTARLVSTRLPKRVHLRVRRQLGQVSAPARHLIQVASVLGRSFRLLDLAGLLGDTSAALLPAVEEALASGLFVCDAQGLAFGHELVRLVVVESIPLSLRCALLDEGIARRGRPTTVSRAIALDRAVNGQSNATVPVIDRAAPPASGDSRTTGWNSLSGRERTIAQLAGQAMTNRQIASRVFLSPHTVNFHLRQIFRKLSINSRVQLARLSQAQLTEHRGTAGVEVAAAS